LLGRGQYAYFVTPRGVSGISVNAGESERYFPSGAVQGMGDTSSVSGMTGTRVTGIHKDANYTDRLLGYLDI
jgi:hypothetical protein